MIQFRFKIKTLDNKKLNKTRAFYTINSFMGIFCIPNKFIIISYIIFKILFSMIYCLNVLIHIVLRHFLCVQRARHNI